MKQRIVTALLALGLCAPLTLPARAAATFNDIPASHWSYSYVQTASNNGWVNGVGSGKYNPNGNVTAAEWYTMALRMAYGRDTLDSVEVPANELYANKWYAKTMEYAISELLFVYSGGVTGSTVGQVMTDMESNISREKMAASIWNILKDYGYKAGDLSAVSIPDMGTVNQGYQYGVKVAYSTGILQGVDSTGKFDPKASMTRAQAATVLCRLYDLLETLPDFDGTITTPETPDVPETPENPETPETPENPGETDTPTGNYGPVGTVSDFVVTLHSSTHAPTVDYWTDAPQWIKDRTDKTAFNCLAQSLLDPENAVATEFIDRTSRNPYYNYAVLDVAVEEDAASQELSRKQSYVSALPLWNQDFSFVNYYDLTDLQLFFTINHVYETRNERDFEFLNKVNDSMSDREVAIEALKMLQQYATYSTGFGSAGIFSEESLNGEIVTRNCDSATLDLMRLLVQVDIPVLKFGWADVPGVGDHTTCYAKLDGEWYVVESTMALGYKGNNIADYCIYTPDDYFTNLMHMSMEHNIIDIPGNGVSTARYLVDVTGFGRNS